MHYIDHAFQLAVMVRARLGIGLNAHRACPDFLRTDAGKIDGSFAVHAPRLSRVRIECMTGDHTDAVMLPVRGMFVAIVAHAPPLLQQELLNVPATRRAGNLIAALGAKRRASLGAERCDSGRMPAIRPLGEGPPAPEHVRLPDTEPGA